MSKANTAGLAAGMMALMAMDSSYSNQTVFKLERMPEVDWFHGRRSVCRCKHYRKDGPRNEARFKRLRKLARKARKITIRNCK